MNGKKVEVKGESNESLSLSVTYYELKEKMSVKEYGNLRAGEFTNLYVKNFPKEDFEDVDLIVSFKKSYMLYSFCSRPMERSQVPV